MGTLHFSKAVAALTVVCASISSAYAVTVSRADGQPMNPNGEPFSVSGSMALSKSGISATCNTTFNGTITSGGIVTITSTQFAGGGTCSWISSNATSSSPWTGQADSTTQLTINNAQVQVLFLGTCGPSKVVAGWDNKASSLTLNNAQLTPNCQINGTMVTSPQFTVQ
ncbi:hypothetical protein [Burkholderia sp. TSV86]|uniref:hypothetical protein n=1 Tax=Burkholderia sp. TSV86 TaxID=1385594 RepID=UPI0007591846|nr:hypothetical protein [Burkholderia sp. TSV86]KVE37675.1 activator protein [Burkholderia sp. TSV86]